MYKQLLPYLEYYHKLIADDLTASDEQLQYLYAQQRERKTLFGDRVMAHSLRPAFMTERMYTKLQDSVYMIRQAILQIAGEYFNDREALEELGMQDWEIELASIPTNVIRLSATARMDAFLTEDTFKFVEVNAESPAGVAYTHEMAKIYRSLPVFKKFEKTHPIRYVSPLEHLVAGLLRTYHEEFDGQEEKPSFAIVDFQNVPTVHEFNLVKAYLERMGYPVEICDPRALEITDGWIYANGRKIDILYRRLLMNEFWEIKDDCSAYLEGYRQQKTCYVNSFRSKLVHKKSIFSFLTDPRYTRILNNVQLQAIREHIPWTRKLRDVKTNHKGQVVDLLPYVRTRKDGFVIKPNDEYGGKGVVIGFAATQQEWEEGIEYGAQHGYVVQEVVAIHKEPFFMKTEKGWMDVPTVVDLDPYLNGPLMGGCLTRTSTSNLANVTAGGGTLPLFILRYAR
jgi:uncharacterized circularly permuted ATP-grasp superfamily protein